MTKIDVGYDIIKKHTNDDAAWIMVSKPSRKT